QVGHPGRGGGADLVQGQAVGVHTVEQADAGAEQHGRVTENSSTWPVSRYSWIVSPPPAMRTSRSPAASRAWSSALSMPSLTKWKMVPPGRSQGSRFSCVTT